MKSLSEIANSRGYFFWFVLLVWMTFLVFIIVEYRVG